MCEGISFFCCHCHHLAFFVCKSLNINTLKNHSFTFLTKTVIIFCHLSSFLSSFCHPKARGCTLWVKFAAWWPKSAEIVNFVKKHPFSGLICAKSVYVEWGLASTGVHTGCGKMSRQRLLRSRSAAAPHWLPKCGGKQQSGNRDRNVDGQLTLHHV